MLDPDGVRFLGRGRKSQGKNANVVEVIRLIYEE
jgi:hypothetical protein